MTASKQLFFTLAIALIAKATSGQVGNDNPTGVAGMFNNNTTTACSVDPYTANATRSIEDIYVSSAVGAYPLALVRTMNTRYDPNVPTPFGQPGGWKSSYNWNIDTLSVANGGKPAWYDVNYADGRRVHFVPAVTNGVTKDKYFHGPPGVRDRLVKLNSNNDCYLRMTDGGSIWFHATTTASGSTITYQYSLKGIIDPYGQTTTVTQPGDGSNTITEPGGRMLKLFYKTGPANDQLVIDRVEEWLSPTIQGRTVQYTYATYNAGGTLYSALQGVSYPDGKAATYTYQSSNTSSTGRPLINTAIDPLYAGPMWKIAYKFVPNASGVVYGQIQSENYYNGTSIGAAVSSLSVTGTSTRTETRGDGPTRAFTYGSTTQSGFTVPKAYMLASESDFKGAYLYKSYDTRTFGGYINAIKDRNGNVTNFDTDMLTGNVLQTTYPLTPSDTAMHLGQAFSTTVYGWSTCPDSNNQDPDNPYYPYTVTNGSRKRHPHAHGRRKRGFSATYTRDTSKRVTTITYPDNTTETFQYSNSLGQVVQHRRRDENDSGGLEVFEYDSRGRLTAYRDAYHLATADPRHPTVPTNATPSLSYGYDTLDRVTSITNGNSHKTTFTYNERSQLRTTHSPGALQDVVNEYDPNGSGTLMSVTNELQKETSYSYDDYKRLVSTTLPAPTPGASPSPTTLSYDHTGGVALDYTHTDANPTRLTLPSGKITKTVYDNNHRQLNITAGYNTSDAATTQFGYDNNGNLTDITDPEQNHTKNWYDQQNRLTGVDDPLFNVQPTPHNNSSNPSRTISLLYDQANNRTSENTPRCNISWVYDGNNHVQQVTKSGAVGKTAITNYGYLKSGFLWWMEDPNSAANNSGILYQWQYDLMGRKITFVLPLINQATHDWVREGWTYDGAGNVKTYTNRAGFVQTFTYDQRERLHQFSWNDGQTPSQTIDYDDASRVTSIVNDNASITNIYYDDNTLQSQEEWSSTENKHRIVSYTYDADLNRLTMLYPGWHKVQYGYTNRDQANSVKDLSTSKYPVKYTYDFNGNPTSESKNGVVTTSAIYNSMNFVSHIEHDFANATRTFDYKYNSTNDRTSIQQDGGTQQVRSYDAQDQDITGVNYDENGNVDDGTSNYQVDSTSEYITFAGYPVSYDSDGNLSSFLGSSYSYDAQNRMIGATVGSNTETFKYDGLNRQISRTLNGTTTYNVWDGWNLIEELAPNATTPKYSFIYGATGEIVERIGSGDNILYFQDAIGSTSHVTDMNGALQEGYLYTRNGAPAFYSPNGPPDQTQSAHDVRHLFHGQLWTQETGLNDYRNRMELPSVGIFMQPDPNGFNGDPTNLYRFCGNSALNVTDSLGLSGTLILNVNPGRGNPMFGGNWGHAWVSFISDQTGHLTTYGNWNEGVGVYSSDTSPAASERVTDYGAYGEISRQTWIDDRGEGALNAFMKSSSGQTWTRSYSCTNFAAALWAAVTAETVPDSRTDTGLGWKFWSTQSFAVSVRQLNGGNNYAFRFSDGGNGYYFADGSYGRYDAAGNGYYLWNANGAPGQQIGQTTNGEPIYAGQPLPLDSGAVGQGGDSPNDPEDE